MMRKIRTVCSRCKRILISGRWVFAPKDNECLESHSLCPVCCAITYLDLYCMHEDLERKKHIKKVWRDYQRLQDVYHEENQQVDLDPIITIFQKIMEETKGKSVDDTVKEAFDHRDEIRRVWFKTMKEEKKRGTDIIIIRRRKEKREPLRKSS